MNQYPADNTNFDIANNFKFEPSVSETSTLSTAETRSPNLEDKPPSGQQQPKKGSRKTSFFQSLQFRLPLFVLLGVVPPILIGLSYASSQASKIIQTNAKEKLVTETQALKENVSDWTRMNVLALQNLSRLPDMVSLDAKEQKPLLEEFVKTYNHIYLASTIGLNGFNIARSDNEALKDYSSRDYFKGAKAGNEITWQSLISKTNKKPAACFSTPIRRQQAVAAVIQGCSNLEEIAQQVGAVKIGETGYAMVVGEAGKLIAHPDPALITGDDLVDFSDYPPVKSLLEGKEGTLDFTDEQGTEWIAYGTSLDNGWSVIIAQEKAEVFLQKQQFERIVWAIALGVVVLVGLIVFLIAKRLVNPIIRLTETSLAFANGDLNQSIHLEQEDEIGVLADSFNTMAEQLQESIAKVESKAQEQQQQKEKLEKEIYQLLDEVEDAVEGDLTVRASLSSMEMSTVADLFNAIIDNLKDIAIQVKDSSTQVSSSLGENEQAIQQLAEQAIQEAEATRQTLTSVEQMSHSIEAVATNANQAATLADDTYTVTQEGAKAVEETVDSILNLKATVSETARKMKQLGESSQRISQVVSLIEEMTLKTNLLAINAGRSGEQGRGFAVFGEQLGLLAEQSAEATREIAQIVTEIQLETQEVSKAMELGTAQVMDSTRLVESTKQRLGQVLERSRTINDLMKSISQATVSQTDTSRTVTQLMQQIAQQSEQRLASSQQVVQSMQTTAQVAKQLESAVDQFKVDEA